MPGTLFLVATPIGNLEDITLRALRVLREADLIAAEDTRRTAKLLSHHAIRTRTLSFHQHNAQTRTAHLIPRLLAGERIALVTDAGTPGISDPGVELVQACITAGVAIDPVPGVSAPLAAAVASGFPLQPLTILGFAPSGAKDRMSWIVATSRISHTTVFFDSPHRIAVTLREATALFGERPIVIGRELTKVHQEFLRGTAQSLSSAASAYQGEITVVLGPAETGENSRVVMSDEHAAALFCELTKQAGYSRRDAIAAVAERAGRTARDVYAVVERSKLMAEDQ